MALLHTADGSQRPFCAAFGAVKPIVALLRLSVPLVFTASLGLPLAMTGCAPAETKVTQQYPGPPCRVPT